MSLSDNISTGWLFLIFLLTVVALSMLGLYVVRLIDVTPVKCKDHNAIISILMGIMAVFLGVMLSFLIVTAWSIYSRGQLDNQKEAEVLYILFEIVSTLPNTEDAQALIIAYLEYVINVEFPAISKGEVPPEGQMFIQDIQRALYEYEPQDPQQTILYQKSIQLEDVVVDLRINRIILATTGLNTIIWWVTVIDSILIIFMSWFLTCANIFHYLVVTVIAIYVGAGLFAILILSNPFRTTGGITAAPFEEVLEDIHNQYDE